MEITVQESSSIKIARHDANPDLRKELLSLLATTFDQDEETYFGYSVDDFRELLITAQNNINKAGIGEKIVKAIAPNLKEYLTTDDILIQSNVYLRGARPKHVSKHENIGWHRETFYGSGMEKAVNIWTPLKGVCEANTLMYIPGSQNIPDDEILVEHQEDDHTKQHSTGHALGFQYRPKIIKKGVDLTNSRPMMVEYGSSAIFDGNLIHGAGQNSASRIRFSLDFRVLRKKDYSSSNKKYHFSSGKPYFIEIGN